MKTTSTIFAVLLSILFLATTGAVICGKTHQWVMAVATGVMAAALWHEVWQQVTLEYEQSAKELREFAELIAPFFPEGKMLIFWKGAIIIPAKPINEHGFTDACNKKTNIPPGLEFESPLLPQESLTDSERMKGETISGISEILQKCSDPLQLSNVHALPDPSLLKNEAVTYQEPVNSIAEFSPYSLM